MSSSTRREYRALYRLVTDVCQLGHDATAWTSRLMTGLCELFDARMIGLAWATLPDAPGGANRVEVELHHGFSDDEMRLWSQTYCGPDSRFESEFLRRVVNIPARFVTVRRQDVMRDDEWYALPEIGTIHRQLDIDANMASFFVALSFGRIFGIGVHRAWSRPQFTVDDRRRLRLLHLELARAWRRRIAHPDEVEAPSVQRLSPRLRQVLWLLCLGRSEKEVARHLDLSPATVHNHVQRLYRELSVRSRGELLARALTKGSNEPVALPDAGMTQFKRQ